MPTIEISTQWRIATTAPQHPMFFVDTLQTGAVMVLWLIEQLTVAG